MDTNLQDADRARLDSIVQKMVANQESDTNIQTVVNDFKQKYGTKSVISPYTGNESIPSALGKIAVNYPRSAMNLAEGVTNTFAHPIKTAEGLGRIAIGAGEALGENISKAINPLSPDLVQDPNRQAFSSAADFFAKRYGGKNLDEIIGNTTKTAIEDPAGFASDLAVLISGGAGVADTITGASKTNSAISAARASGATASELAGVPSKVGATGAIERGVGAVGGAVTAPFNRAADWVSPLVGKTSKYITSQATGLNPETITELLNNPEAFKNVSPEARTETANAVKDALEKRLSELSGVGKEYQVIRDSGQLVGVPENTIKDVLNKYGVKLDENNQILTTPESRPLSTGDRASLQDFINNYGKERVLSSNAFLNTREALSNMAKYDASKTDISTHISRDMRSAYDELGKGQIKGLNELDTQYAPERELLNQVKRDILTPKGELKDGAISKIANLTGKGKEKLLERVKEIVPDIEQRVRVIKAVEDIERTSGIKVGTYMRTAVAGGGLLTGNIPAVVGAILSQPEIAVPLLKGAGYIGEKARPVLNALKAVANDVNNFRLPSALINKETGGLNLGLSVQDVSDFTKRQIAERGKNLTVPNFPKEFEPRIAELVSEMQKNNVGASNVDPSGVAYDLKKEAMNFENTVGSAQDITRREIDLNRFFTKKLEEIKKGEGAVPQTSQKITDMNQFERAKDLSSENRTLEGKAFRYIMDNEDAILTDYFHKNGKMVNADLFRPYFKKMGYSGTNAAAVQEPVSYLAKRAIAKSLDNKGDYVIGMAGGSGVGKTSVARGIPTINSLQSGAAFTLDSNFSNLTSARRFIKQVKDAGKQFIGVYTYRDLMDSVFHGVIPRMLTNPEEMGRVVPNKITVANHLGSWDVVKQLVKDGEEFYFVDNSLDKPKLVDFKDLNNKIKYSNKDDILRELNRESKNMLGEGKINHDQYRGLID